jgi:hypothetical protein
MVRVFRVLRPVATVRFRMERYPEPTWEIGPVANRSYVWERVKKGDNISKKYFRPGGMSPSEWTRSIRAVRDTPVEDYPAPGLNTTRRVAYRPPIAVSTFLLALSVSYFKRTL